MMRLKTNGKREYWKYSKEKQIEKAEHHIRIKVNTTVKQGRPGHI
jgi:hypothetical protein